MLENESFRGFSDNSRKFSKFENENEGSIWDRELVRVIFEIYQISRTRMRVKLHSRIFRGQFSKIFKFRGENEGTIFENFYRPSMNGFGAEWCGNIFILCNNTLKMALLLHKTAFSPKLLS